MGRDTQSYSFDDFASVEAIDAVWPETSDALREDLVVWQYALVRSSILGRARPTEQELQRLQNDILSSLTSGNAIKLGTVSGVILIVGTTVLLPALQAGDTSTAALSGALCLFAAVLLGAQIVKLARPRSRAMRMVWAARLLPTSERRASMEQAVRLESGDAAGAQA